MSKCPECKTEMKALFVGEYCPNDCDKPEVLAKRKYEAEVKKLAESKSDLSGWVHPLTYWLPALPGSLNTKIDWAKIKKAQDVAAKPRIWVSRTVIGGANGCP